MSSIKVLGVGSPIVDILAQVSHDHLEKVPGAKGGMELVDENAQNALLADIENIDMATGGSASNTVVGLLKLGLQASLLGKVGTCEHGKFFTESFQKAGGSLEAFKFDQELANGTCLSLITPDTERTMRTNLGAAAALLTDEVSLADFEAYNHVHVEGYVLFNPPLAQKVLESAKEAGCTVSLDLASFEVVGANLEKLPALLSDYVDMVFANEDEAKAFTQTNDPLDAFDALAEHCHTVAVKLGPDGAHVRQGDDKVFVPADKVDAVDSTGAGDLWASGLLYGLLTAQPLEKSATLASKTGAAVVQIIGAVIPDTTWEEIKKSHK